MNIKMFCILEIKNCLQPKSQKTTLLDTLTKK
jgi:hypothetical protein